MEVAEALSSKLGIMVDGRFTCFGSLQSIKNTYGKGYEIELNIGLDSLVEKFPHISLDQRYAKDYQTVLSALREWTAHVREAGI